MTDVIKNRIRCICGAVLSCLLALAGICLCAACLGIYLSGGEDPFSRAAVAQAFRPIAWVIWLCLGGIVAAFAVRLLLPEPVKSKPEKQLLLIRDRLRATRELDMERLTAADSLTNAREGMEIVGVVLLIVGSLVFLIYACNGSHFHDQDINGSVIRAMYWLLGCMGVPFGWAVYAAYAGRRYLALEIEILRQAPKATSPLPVAQTAGKSSLGWVRWLFLVAGIAALVYGFLAGGTLDVLTKAINICTECVGLG